MYTRGDSDPKNDEPEEIVMSKPILSVSALSYALSIFYGTSFFVYLTALSLPPLRIHGLLLAVLSLVLFFCTLGAAKLKENGRRALISFNILLWAYSLFLLKSHPGLVQVSYIWVYLVVVLPV